MAIVIIGGFGFAIGAFVARSQMTEATQSGPTVVQAEAEPVAEAPTPAPPTPTSPAANPAQENTETASNVDRVAAGETVFLESCAPCHGADAQGIAGIGLNLRMSDFVGALSDEELAHFIAIGRDIDNPLNTTGIPMPARGGRSDLSDQDLLNVATFLHSINEAVGARSAKAEEYRTWLKETEQQQATIIGETTYLRYCAVCHGPDGKGRPGLGKDLVDSTFIAGKNDEELALFIKQGRPVGDPLNTTGIAMLPFGGQPPFSDQVMQGLVSYLRSINLGEQLAEIPTPTPLPTPAVPTPEPAAETPDGWAVIGKVSPPCLTCHLIGDRGSKFGPGPNLNELGNVAGDRVEGLSAEEYVRQSIVDPGAHIVKECPTGKCINAMPKNYGDQLSEEDLDTLVQFLLGLANE
jgi:mono/diheme cytochrome c family protein